MCYEEVVMIVLTATTAILAALGIGLAVLAFVGYRQLKNFAKAIVIQEVKDQLSEKGDLRKDIRKELKQDVVNQIDNYAFREARRIEDLPEEDDEGDGM